MIRKMASLCIAGLMLNIGASSSAATSALPLPLETAINNLRETASTQWAYTRETHDNIGHYTERFDPTLPRDQQWQLLAFDEKSPTPKHQTRYEKEYESLFERDTPTDVDLTTFIDPDTVERVTENDERLEFTFQPQADDEEDARVVMHLLGTIVLSKNPIRLNSMKLKNLRKIKPVKIVSIKTLIMGMDFAPITTGGPIGIVSSHSLTEGRFMGLKKFSETETVKYYDFEFKDAAVSD